MTDTTTNPGQGEPPAQAPASPPNNPPASPGTSNEPPAQGTPPDPTQQPPQNPPTGEDGKTLIGKPADDGAPAGLTFDGLDAEGIKSLAPEGFEISDDQATKLHGLLGEAKTPEDLVKGLFNYHGELLTNFGEELAAEFNTRMAEWANEVESAPEYQGGKLEPALAQANELADRFGGKEFMELLSVTGAGNSIHTLRFFQNLSKALPQEGTPPTTGAPSVQPKSLAERLFGDQGANQ